mmetsp:Transcript_31663/g.51437  ORF Transcript_31663/g.51437 Transcript_31663/m.51437 type:complete len:416 (-) Transcript_31663:192-1439(-)
MWLFFLWVIIIALTLLLLVTTSIRVRRRRGVAFFHPYAECRGGGERVLFLSIQAVQEMDPNLPIFVYCGCKTLTGVEILEAAKQTFKINKFPRPDNIHFVQQPSLKNLRFLLEPSTYPRLTLLGQSIGSMIVAAAALWEMPADIFIDTTGFAFTYPIAWICGCKVISYTHYPTVSTDMITVVKSGKEAFNNSKLLANITLFRRLKVWYYKVFAWIYGVVGQFSHLVLVNSSWTLNHIVALWNVPDRTHILYPPADTKYLQKFAVDRRAPPRCQPSSSSSSSTNLVISLGQFRPEKNQELQLRAFARFLRNHRQQQQQEKRPLEEKKGKRIDDKNIKLVLIGGCRNEDDQKRVKNLKHLASTLGILDRVVFEVNASFKLLVEYLAAAHVGLHTMVNEHFGIGVVEFMAGNSFIDNS